MRDGETHNKTDIFYNQHEIQKDRLMFLMHVSGFILSDSSW